MGVYIKNMIMPKNCFECPFGTDVDIGTGVARGCEFLKDFSPFSDERHNDCPLIEIPPHGRLIDADAFIKRISELVRKAETDGFDLGAAWYKAFIRHIELAPTIIPADKEEING